MLLKWNSLYYKQHPKQKKNTNYWFLNHNLCYMFLDFIPDYIRKNIELWCNIVFFCISVVASGAIVIDYGFALDDYEMRAIEYIYEFSWFSFLIAYITRLALGWQRITHKTLFLTIFSGLLLLLSATTFLPPDVLSGIAATWYSALFFKLAISFFAVLEISRGVVNFINKKTNPALLLASCFAIVIILGALLLLLPRSTHEGIRISIVDSFFISTSAVCVTGLTPLDIAQTFTREGQIVIMLLIQIGGLGVMTITSFFTMFFMGGAGLYKQFALRDMVGSDTFDSLISTLLYILGFTFVIELIGSIAIWLSIHDTLGLSLPDELFFALFHSVSAFCNAGFSTLSGNLGNEAVMTGHNMFFLFITLLVVLGGISFPILVNFKNVIFYHIRRLIDHIGANKRKRPRVLHLTNLNTKIVLTMTTVLLGGGTIAMALFEWNGAFAGMPVVDKIVQSLFNAAVPRTAGFNSVDLAKFSVLSIMVYTFLMWIGGASQSTAGGIKVNTFAVALANLYSVIRGQDTVILFNREIMPDSLRRALAVIFGSLLFISVTFIIIVYTEPDIAPRSLLFEVVSAYSTVGASLNVTPLLNEGSKIILSLVMFTGRVGLVTILTTILPATGRRKLRYPKDNIIIN